VEMPGIEPGSTTSNHSLLRAYLVKAFCSAHNHWVDGDRSI